MYGPWTIRRFASTKIPVQLLKDIGGLGYRGEVVKVAPGRMRNELHVDNKAYYVLKGVPLRIPLVDRAEIERVKKEEKRVAAVKSDEERRREEKRIKHEKEKQDLERFKYLTNLTFSSGDDKSSLSKKTSGSISSSAEAYLLQSALKSLPPIFRIKRSTTSNESGYLEQHYNSQEYASQISGLIGSTVSPEIVKFSIRVAKGQQQDSTSIDHIGRYRVIFNLPFGVNAASSFLEIESSQELVESVPKARPYGPLSAADSESTSASAGPQPEPEIKISSGKKGEPSTKKFEWENGLIASMQDRMKQ